MLQHFTTSGLRAFDSNKEGQLDSADKRFGDFKVWADYNGNGIADAGELVSLHEAGVESIALAGTAETASFALGDVIVLN